MVNLYALALLFNADNKIVLVRRFGTSFDNGNYGLVGGKVEAGETARQAIRREVYEEVGLDIPEHSFTLVHTFHRKGTETELVSLCFKADIAGMEPYNKEPEKHDDMRFFALSHLPENMVSAHKRAATCFLQHITYSEDGW